MLRFGLLAKRIALRWPPRVALGCNRQRTQSATSHPTRHDDACLFLISFSPCASWEMELVADRVQPSGPTMLSESMSRARLGLPMTVSGLSTSTVCGLRGKFPVRNIQWPSRPQSCGFVQNDYGVAEKFFCTLN